MTTPRPSGWEVTEYYPSDPVPGDPEAVRAYAGGYREIAEHIAAAARGLRDMDSISMQSKAVEKFQERARELAGEIEKAEPLYTGTAAALQTYATGLDDAQIKADAALTAAATASEAATTARYTRMRAQEDVELAGSDPAARATAQEALTAASTAVDGYEADFRGAVDTIHEAVGDWEDAATAAINAIEEIADGNALKDSFWDKLGDFVGDLVDFLEAALTWISDILDKFEILLLVASIVLLFVPGGGLLVMALRVLTLIGKIQRVVKIARTTVDIIQVVRGKKSAIEFLTGVAKGQLGKLFGKGINKVAGGVLDRVLARTGAGTLFSPSTLAPNELEIRAVPGTFRTGNANFVRMSMLNDSYGGAYTNGEFARLATQAGGTEGAAHLADWGVGQGLDAGTDWVNNELTEYSLSNGGNPYLFDWNDPLGEPQPFGDYRGQVRETLGATP
ncbi:hypothetical protein GB881_03755 [Georgenia subflava]|uniref:Putative T7SS secretion signal domain-containing protein n=1 Tax=Georgenia subflava TaxID=1622177 RepID=A0A6N7EGS2_9MICO|nr:hypothetical protein [Georgenia subflava]MPV36168.1 hypothetical protein [Georgenia subflava]